MMEYIPGRSMDKCMADDGRDEAQQIYAQYTFGSLNILSEIAVPPRQPPGPVGGGVPRGYLFEGCNAEFGSIQEMNAWLNERLLLAQDPTSKVYKTIDVHEQARTGTLEFQNTLCMVHGDPAPRNFIMKHDGQLALLDWGLLGFIPRSLKLFVLE